ncbi:NAD(P)-binding protein [Aaosphaeria arxii CBS 175.79]|uniref:NAD(P)-binding protein n=1 Tax=Aaosphaeria arxii CBS 175.79 TaxID=1450172 RepID=A0A6A5XMU9_9PLEO|nr:NAD(P)-binding protein [Aaosphaeria arxii CBS 175.79]KAF2014070.1 NAD(P)-binding protein [Aaosphaeria arxii CBS 175.79]
MASINASRSSARQLVWLVTGCSSGLGQQIALAILAHDDCVIATARQLTDLEYLNTIEGGRERAYCTSLDVTNPCDRIHEQLKKAIAYFGRVDVLVNNAGFVVSGVWEEVSDAEVRQQFETNFFGTMKVTRCVLPYMRNARSGVILFMGSIAGWHGVGAGGPYSASKFAIEGAAESLSKEVSHLGIRTHVLVLGQFRTNILEESRKCGTVDLIGIQEYDAIKAEMVVRHKKTHGKQPGDPKAAAERVLDIARLENLSEKERIGLGLRVPLGSDAIDVIQLKCSKTLDSLEKWVDFAHSTDFPISEHLPSYAM